MSFDFADMQREWPDVRQVALSHGIDPLFIMSVRKHENGPPSIEDGHAFGEFGLPTFTYPTYGDQLKGCVKTIRTYLNEYPRNPFIVQSVDLGYRRLVYSDSFIAHAGARYAPVGVSNDPQGLNKNWPIGVGLIYHKMWKVGMNLLAGWNLEVS